MLEKELMEESKYQDYLKTYIAQLKRNIYEVKQEREKYIKDINAGRKIHKNLQSMAQMVAQDAEKV